MTGEEYNQKGRVLDAEQRRLSDILYKHALDKDRRGMPDDDGEPIKQALDELEKNRVERGRLNDEFWNQETIRAK